MSLNFQNAQCDLQAILCAIPTDKKTDENDATPENDNMYLLNKSIDGMLLMNELQRHWFIVVK